MLRQLLVGTAVSVCNIAIHALVMATVLSAAVFGRDRSEADMPTALGTA
jgi:hypothetical protein